ncbi:MAG: diguanylate cyclase domain-containing protein [Gemmatimonadales bacterium]
MSDEFEERDEILEQLRREYLAEAPARLSELRKDLAAARAGESDALASLKSRFHKLAGSGGSYGFPAITEAARAGEHWLLEHTAQSDEDYLLLGAMIGRVAAAFDEAAHQIGSALAAHKPPPFGWRALVLGGPSELGARVAAVLRDAQYVVNLAGMEVGPGEVPVSERPEIVVVVPASGEDPRGAVTAWLNLESAAQPALALVAEPGLVDLLGEPFARLDQVVSAERAEAELVRWARGIGRAAGTPFSVLLVLPEEAERSDAVTALEAAGIEVATAATAAEALQAVQDDAPDVVVIDWELPFQEAAALTRELRRSIRFALTPLLGLSNLDTDTARERALAAGADDLLIRPVGGGRLVAAVVHRARRARRLDEVIRRDPLTGFLPAAMLPDELELILAHARRGGEQLAFVLFDLDHFRRVNEQLGSGTGDAILVHVARAIRNRVRASDLIVRMGGEEFGILFRACGPAQARAISNEIRAALLAAPPQVEGVAFPVRLSAGIAAYPDHALGSRELVLVAERALREAKETGRDKVVLPSGWWQVAGEVRGER